MIGTLKRWAARQIGALGYTVIPNWQLAGYPQAQFLSRLFALCQVDCVLDVGANRGQYFDFLRRDVGYEGLVVSFEPVPTLGEHLRRRVQPASNWSVQAYALGAARGTASLNVMASDQFSSFLAPSHAATEMFLAQNQVTGQAAVDVRTLDEVLPALRDEWGFRRPYLKLDTQGFDLAVIQGAQDSLPGIVALQTEAAVTPIYEGAPDFAQVIRHLEGQGFALSAIFPNNPDHFPLMIEFDCHMVSRVHVPARTRTR